MKYPRLLSTLTVALLGCSQAETPSGAKAATKTAKEAKEAEPAEEAAPAKEAEPAKPAAINVDEEGRGLHGYDAVAYHSEPEPVEGKAEHSFSWGGATWLFASAENLAKFSENPDKYAPRNGGYCTFGVVINKKFDGDPSVWHLSEEQLYVFLNAEAKDKFLQDEAGNFEKVRANWATIKDKKPEELE